MVRRLVGPGIPVGGIPAIRVGQVVGIRVVVTWGSLVGLGRRGRDRRLLVRWRFSGGI